MLLIWHVNYVMTTTHRSKLVTAMASASLLVLLGGMAPTAASAAETQTGGGAIEEIREQLPAAELEKFDALSDSDQELFVQLLDDPAAYEETVVSEETTLLPSDPNERATTKNYSRVMRVNSGLFGITVGQYRQEMRYSVTGSTTKSPSFCSGTFTGWAGFWSIATSSSKWVQSNKAYCNTNYTLAVLWQGNSVQMNKQMRQTGTIGGSISGYLKNI